MLISLNWLNDFVDIDCDIDYLCAKLVSAGFEVEEVIRLADNCKKVVVGRIESLEKHPDADKLQVCQINIGNETVQIVTGANNIKVGDLVPVALDGSDLPNGVHIKKGKLRGVPSNGMLCSGEELKLTEADYKGASDYGILILKEDYKLGTDVNEVLGTNDIVLDIGVTANRPDCNSVLGIAREVSTLLNKPLKMPQFDYIEDNSEKIEDLLSVDVLNNDLCPRYIAAVVKDIQRVQSPKYIRNRLKAVGLRPIDALVDITNYVLMEIGQPMHAFDYDLVEGKKIIVRNAMKDESIRILTTNEEYKLDESMLAVCDAIKPSAIAGVMGGADSAIHNDTKSVVFESAKFMRENIRKTSRKLNLRSDSSNRFERGIDLSSQELGMKRALALISKHKIGRIVSGVIDVNKCDLNPRIVTASIDKINEILGITVPTDTMVSILNSLQIETVTEGNNLVSRIPLYRDDIENANDISEEIIRLYGYDNINCSLLDYSRQTIGGKSINQKNVDNVKFLLVGEGLNEINTYSFTTPKMFDCLQIPNDSEKRNVVKILNPLGEDLSIMRNTLTYSMLEIMAKNLSRNNKNIRLFEFANIYAPKSLPLTEQPTETTSLSIGICGENEDFYTLKGIIENIILYYGVNESYKRSKEEFLHPGISADIMVQNNKIGYLGEIHPNVLKFLNVKDKLYIAELNIDLLNKLYDNSYEFKQIPKFPSVDRDLAVVVDERITAEDILSAVKSAGVKGLAESRIFDIYRGKGVEQGKKSIAINLLFSSMEKTLTEEDISSKINKIIKKLESVLNAKLR